MKVIITENQMAAIIEGEWLDAAGSNAGEVINKGGKWLMNTKLGKSAQNKAMEVGSNIVQGQVNTPISLSPEMQARFGDINIERDAPNLSKFMSGMKDAGNIDSLAASVKGGSVTIPEGEIMMNPLGRKVRISSKFGERHIKDKRGKPIGSTNHKGVDLDVPSGSPVYAPLDGVVIKSLDSSPNPCGGHVRLKHKNFETLYCHLSKMVAKPGSKVKKGDIIGYSGGGENDPYRGVSTGSHLHYAIVNKNGVPVDPLSGPTNLV
jgi:murein DD-endopeptidase MepM/ murein hydrolase activator NlpD